MEQVTLHGKPIKVGDKVWQHRLGETVVVEIYINDMYPIVTEDSSYSTDGKLYLSDKYPSLFWKEQSFDKSKPLPDLKVDDKIIVGDTPFKENGFKRYFCKFDENGNAVVFREGRTSWNSDGKTNTWKYWKLPDDLSS